MFRSSANHAVVEKDYALVNWTDQLLMNWVKYRVGESNMHHLDSSIILSLR
jgi:hypothetical protein